MDFSPVYHTYRHKKPWVDEIVRQWRRPRKNTNRICDTNYLGEKRFSFAIHHVLLPISAPCAGQSAKIIWIQKNLMIFQTDDRMRGKKIKIFIFVITRRYSIIVDENITSINEPALLRATIQSNRHTESKIHHGLVRGQRINNFIVHSNRLYSNLAVERYARLNVWRHVQTGEKN